MAAMGALAEATVPAGMRWLPKRMEVDYLAKASSDLICVAETTEADWAGAGGARAGMRHPRRRHRRGAGRDPPLGHAEALTAQAPAPGTTSISVPAGRATAVRPRRASRRSSQTASRDSP